MVKSVYASVSPNPSHFGPTGVLVQSGPFEMISGVSHFSLIEVCRFSTISKGWVISSQFSG